MAIRSGVEKINPQIADAILTASKDHVQNRKVKDRHVEWLASQMKAGKWLTNGEPIILDQEGLLLDGQHRLWAVMIADKEIETVVTRGVDRSTFSTIDTGAARTSADVITMTGEVNGTVLASVLGWLYRYESGKMLWNLKGAGFTSAAGLAILKKHSGVRDEITWACSTARANVILSKIPKSPLAFLKYVFTAYKPNKAAEFFDFLGDIRMDSMGTPTRVFRDWLLKDERSRAPASTLELMAIMVKAWTAFLNDEKPKTYVWRRTGAYPESFPAFPGDKDSRGKAIRGTVDKEKAQKARRDKKK
jgi:hypothetical protein